MHTIDRNELALVSGGTDKWWCGTKMASAALATGVPTVYGMYIRDEVYYGGQVARQWGPGRAFGTAGVLATAAGGAVYAYSKSCPVAK
jgi:hypothetical protein